ncbi:hypothetical protein V1515DRAFT_260579 [Lipomyces mesembrius]
MKHHILVMRLVGRSPSGVKNRTSMLAGVADLLVVVNPRIKMTMRSRHDSAPAPNYRVSRASAKDAQLIPTANYKSVFLIPNREMRVNYPIWARSWSGALLVCLDDGQLHATPKYATVSDAWKAKNKTRWILRVSENASLTYHRIHRSPPTIHLLSLGNHLLRPSSRANSFEAARNAVFFKIEKTYYRNNLKINNSYGKR